MEDIYSLIQCLSSREWESFQSFLTCFSTRGKDPEELKQLQLAKILRGVNFCPDIKYCCLRIYGVKQSRTFDKLKSRLKDKVLDFLLSDISPDKQFELDEVDLAYVRIKKLSAQYMQLFYSKSISKLAVKLLDEIILLSKKYEYFLAAVDHIKLKRGIIGWKSSNKVFEELSAELDEQLKKSEIFLRVEYNYHKLFTLYGFSGRPNKSSIKEFLEKVIDETRIGLKKSQSNIVHYYLKVFEMDYAMLNENYFDARSECLEMLKIVRNNKAVYRQQRIGIVYDHLSRCEYYLGNYTEAAEWAVTARTHFKAGTENYFIATEQIFYALFAQRDFERAADQARLMATGSNGFELGEFRYAQYNCLWANALFMQEKYAEVLQMLAKDLEISRDKPGWEVGIRVLKIMALIELQKLDDASKAIHSLRQFIKYTQKKFPVGPREKTILNLLLVAERNGFQFNTLKGQANKYLDLLSQKGGTNSWEPFTHEVIPFHTWFGQKLKKKHKEPPAKKPGRKEAVAL